MEKVATSVKLHPEIIRRLDADVKAKKYTGRTDAITEILRKHYGIGELVALPRKKRSDARQ
jgi:metal-responsive CopG/Arc/MetJ family transcriptional regulator